MKFYEFMYSPIIPALYGRQIIILFRTFGAMVGFMDRNDRVDTLSCNISPLLGLSAQEAKGENTKAKKGKTTVPLIGNFEVVIAAFADMRMHPNKIQRIVSGN
ncbi:MAG: hypothetical protein J5720_06185 [Bacteroidaceae bacterium]|nr:hypothetical protein [Bacteroidaceae bacterium]